MRILTAAIGVCIIGGLVWKFSMDNQYQAHVGALNLAQEASNQTTAKVESATGQNIASDEPDSIEATANKGEAILALPQPPDTNQTNLEEIEKDAKSGVLEAQYKLGLMYAKGDRVPKDVVKGYMWLHRAAKGGFADAVHAREKIGKGMSKSQIQRAKRQAASKTSPR